MSLLRDAHFGTRVLLRRPGFAAAVVLTLALGTGATTAIFSIVNAALLRPLPYREPDRLMMVWERNVSLDAEANVVSPFNFMAWKAGTRSFSGLDAFVARSGTLTGQGKPQWLRLGLVSPGFFSTVGVEPILGRTFSPEEAVPGGPLTAVLGHGLWRSTFGGDPAVVGRTIRLNDIEVTVLGVLPQGFELLEPLDLWIPLAINPAQPGRGRFLTVVGRLGSGVSEAQAQAEMDALARTRVQQEVDYLTGWDVNVMPLREHLTGDSRDTLLMLLGAVVFVLLIACANVANLFLSRATTRQREVAIRAALGADRSRLIRQMLTESTLTALAGGVAGVAVAWLGTRLLARLAPESLPFLASVGMDWRVLLFAAGVILAVAILSGLAPAMVLMRPDLREDLKEGGKATEGQGRLRLRHLLVVTDVAMAVVLLVGSGLMLRSLQLLQSVDLGYEPDHLLTFRIGMPEQRYPGADPKAAFTERVLETIEAMPGVQSVSAGSILPMGGAGIGHAMEVDGRPKPAPGQEIPVDLRFVTRGYFRTLGIPLVAGRDFTSRDRRGSPHVIVIGQHTARTVWPGEPALGKRIHMDWLEVVDGEVQEVRITATVVGIVGDIREKGFESEPETMLYWPLRQMSTNPIHVAVRSAADPAALATTIRNAVESLDPDLPIYEVATMEEQLARSIAQRRFSMALLTLFSALALVLAAIGIYGVLSYAVNLRTREIGLRIALGSARSSILRLIVGQGLRLALLGLAVGLPLAYALAKLLASLLYKVGLTDPMVYGAAPVLLLGVVLLACYLPARRAARLDPMVALRSE
ncbi:MAG TPA: ABC transporter permease [Thermoanaerobaculia bacterium]|nr:ABC transporter permease [Thermoanaerobaculia bacterium]